MVNDALVHPDRTAQKAVERDPLQIGRWPCCRRCKAGRGLYPFGGRGRRRGAAEISRRRECALLSCNLANAFGRLHNNPPAAEATLEATRSKGRTFASRTTRAASFAASHCCGSTRGFADYGKQDSVRPRSLEEPSTSHIFRNPANAAWPQDAA